MGVPTFYRWLTSKYPKVVVDCVEENVTVDSSSTSGLTFVPVNKNEPNPTGIEIDNLYLDMNGIIHPCSHPENGLQPESEEEMILNVFSYVDRVMNCCRPRKLLYLAVDGVAPRAKLNQQRMRRYKAANERRIKQEIFDDLKQQFVSEGRTVVEDLEQKWDHNVITPGTPFMSKLMTALRYHVKERLTCDPGWRNLIVIFSDSSVPGEGEHKIMNFIREQRTKTGFDNNMTHCIYGMDADLIMLALATHCSKFYIIREVFMENNGTQNVQSKFCYICRSAGHWGSECDGEKLDQEANRESLAARGVACETVGYIDEAKVESDTEAVVIPEGVSRSSATFKSTWIPLQFLSIPVLREYLAAEFSFKDAGGCFLADDGEEPRRIEVERCFDDFLLFCFFVGNDFLPHLPSLSITKGSIDAMMLLYKSTLPQLRDYLTCEGSINFEVMAKFIYFLAMSEAATLNEEWKKSSIRSQRDQGDKSRVEELRKARTVTVVGNPLLAIPSPYEQTENLAAERPLTDAESRVYFMRHLEKRVIEKNNHTDNNERVVDKTVAMGNEDVEVYRSKFYRMKFNLVEVVDNSGQTDGEVEATACLVARAYIEGMVWVLQYYFQGVPNWNWFYPYHYAPFTVDILKYGVMAASVNPHVKDETDWNPITLLGKLKASNAAPLKAFEQLLCVLPPASGHALPEDWRSLMTEKDHGISDFYPERFAEDPDGRKMSYAWVSLLPFVDPPRLAELVTNAGNQLTACDENVQGHEELFVHEEHPVAVASQGSKEVVSFGTSAVELPKQHFPLTRDVKLLECDREIEQHSPLMEISHKRYGCFPWPAVLPKGFKALQYKMLPALESHNKSNTGTGADRVEPVLEDADRLNIECGAAGAKNQFNSATAQRIIAQVLKTQGIHPQQGETLEEQRYKHRRY